MRTSSPTTSTIAETLAEEVDVPAGWALLYFVTQVGLRHETGVGVRH